jgi:hypothetical protein
MGADESSVLFLCGTPRAVVLARPGRRRAAVERAFALAPRFLSAAIAGLPLATLQTGCTTNSAMTLERDDVRISEDADAIGGAVDEGGK